jgi:voltage-gated potassium channel
MVAHQVAVQAGLRGRLYRELEPSVRARGLSGANLAIVGLVVLSLLIFALETEPTLPDGFIAVLQSADHVILAIFALEYVVRLWAVGEDARYRGLSGRLRYATSFHALADLLAFAPELLWMTFAPAGDAALTPLRILRLARLLKIARYVPAFAVLAAAFVRARSQLLIALILAVALVYVSAVLLYFIEGVAHGREAFASIPRAVWWAVATLTTVGYGDVYPVTVGGRIAAAVIALAGIGVVALPAGIFASAFSDELREREAARRRSGEAGPAAPSPPDGGP